MRVRENKCQFSQNDILHLKFSEFYLCFHNSCEILECASVMVLPDLLHDFRGRDFAIDKDG